MTPTMAKSRGRAQLQTDAPWRASASKSVPKIHRSLPLRVSTHALSVMKHPNPVGSGLATEAIVEAAGPDCIVPGQITPVRLLGVKRGLESPNFVDMLAEFKSIKYLAFNVLCKVWPIEVDLKFIEPVGRELKLLGKFMDNAVNLMNKSFIDR